MNLFKSLSHRPFALLWSGQTISRFGDSLYRIALAWWVLEKTGSAAQMGIVVFFSLTPMIIFLLIGGVVVDRLPRLRVMLSSDLLSGLVISVVAFLAYTGQLELWHIYIASLLFGFVEAFFFPAYSAAVPEITPSEMLPSANSLTDLSRQLTGMIGPSIGAVIVAVGGTPLAFALDALSFFTSAICVSIIRHIET
ncbi:MAG: MFS transporter, partial [Chloroflexi bacterium]|nr:MFS transporter [Chloroflexota bacterium]